MRLFKRQSGFPYRAVIIASILIAALVIVLERLPVGERTVVPERRETKPPVPAPASPGLKGPEGEVIQREIAVIIDDVGFDLRLAEELARIKAPVAFAVLPYAPHAAKSARLLHRAGKEILLHLPMEPHSYPADNPGEGALFTRMADGEIRKSIAENLASVPYVTGVNNHMGSRFMEDEAKLAVVMEELAKRGLLFVDSLTTPGSRGRTAAAKAGVPCAVRTAFIDHTAGYAAAHANLVNLRPGQGKRGEPLLMIGHPRPDTLRALRDAQSSWHKQGVRMIALSKYVERHGAVAIRDGAETGQRHAKETAGRKP